MELDAIRGLAEDMPPLWHAPTTTAKDRQAIARLVLDHVAVQADGERVEVACHRAGGVQTRHATTRPVRRFEQLHGFDQMLALVRDLRGQGCSAAAVAEQLNAAGCLKAALVMAGVPAAQAKGTYLRDKFHRLKARMGTKKAAIAIAHKILVAAFHRLQRGVGFADLGADHLDRINKHRTAKRLARRLTALGYDVMLRPKATAWSVMLRHPSVPGPPARIFGPTSIAGAPTAQTPRELSSTKVACSK